MTKAFKDVITKELYTKSLTKSWSVTLDDQSAFPPSVHAWIWKKSRQLGVPTTYISFPLLSATAFCLGESYVSVCETYTEPIIIYSLISGRSGTNKSGSLKVVTDLINNLQSDANSSYTFDTGMFVRVKSLN